MIRIHHLSAGYQQPVLENISCHIPAGSVTAIVGPNGCGKTTLLRALTGQLRPMEGGITLGGREIPA